MIQSNDLNKFFWFYFNLIWNITIYNVNENLYKKKLVLYYQNHLNIIGWFKCLESNLLV
jgi:hypothetical protein